MPGLLVGIGLMIYSHFFGPVGIGRGRSSFGEVSDAMNGAVVPLVITVIIMGGILSGFFTPTEAAVVAVACIQFVAIPLLNRGYFRQLPHDRALTGLLYSIPLITIAAASAFGDHRDACIGADDAALRHGAADGVQVHRRAFRLRDDCVIPDLSRVPGRNHVLHLLPDVVLWLPRHLPLESVGCFKNPSGAGYICP